MVRAVLLPEFLCQAEALCSAWQARSVPQIFHTVASKDTKRGRSHLTLKSCHWDGSGQRRISTLPLNHADKSWGQQLYCSRLVALCCKVQKLENLSMAQRNWSDLSKVTCLFTHTGKHCENTVAWSKGSGFGTPHFLTYLAQTLGGKKKMRSRCTICY